MCSPLTGGSPISVVVPPKGTASSFDIGGWNIEWFGDTANGPTDENLQRDNVADVLLGTDMDIWGLAEVVSTPQFDQVMAKLPGYKGFISDNALVRKGRSGTRPPSKSSPSSTSATWSGCKVRRSF
jgi:hypothetical protein